MSRFAVIIAIIGLSLGAVSAQVNSGVASSPPRELLTTNGLPSASRSRVVTPATRVNAASAALDSSVALSQLYRIGVGDVLDVQLADMPTARSTLFTVLDGGILDYPLAGQLVIVAGKTVEEVAAELRARVKVFENPQIVVKVRDFASHNVIITGLVSDPGAKFLRRETIPLYVVLVEAQPRPEALTAVITRRGQAAINVELNDQRAMSTPVLPGDVIKVNGSAAAPAGFFFAGGAVSSPGQKAFHSGLTLTQAIIASGGTTREAGSKVKISRQGADGRLLTTEYNLRQIQDGKAVDPVLLRGDRITVGESR